MKLNVNAGSRRLLSGSVVAGSVVTRARGKVVLENARVEGRILPKNFIPCRLAPPRGDVMHMTSGNPASSHLNAIYFLDYDIAVRFDAARFSVSGGRVKFSGKKCSVTVVRDYYKKRFNGYFKRFDKRKFPRAPVGWLSWYCYFCDFDEKKTRKTADFAQTHFKPYGFEYVLIECWQQKSDKLPVRNYHSNLEPDPRKFPHGLRYVTDMIHRKGLKAGIWIVPLGTGEEKFFKGHREMHVLDREGNPVGNWSGRYVLDITHPKASKHIARTISTVVRKWKFDYIKIDGLEMGGTGYARAFFDQPSVKRLLHRKGKDPLRRTIGLLKKSMGDETFFLACGAELSPKSRCPGLVHAARIGGDVFWDGEDPNWKAVINTARVTTNAYHVHNIAWYNDPDVLSIRKPLSSEYARMLCTIVGLTGQLLFLSDILYELPAERVRMLQKLMPVCDTYPAHLARNEKLQPIWNLIIRRDFEQWNVATFFNWDEHKPFRLDVTATRLGLDPKKEYLLYDFWNEKFIGVMKRRKTLHLKKQSCVLTAIREKRDHPQILSIDRHITQGGVSLKAVKWDRQTLSLEVESSLPAGKSFTATLYVPAGFKLAGVTGAAGTPRRRKEILKLRVRNGKWKASFVRR